MRKELHSQPCMCQREQQLICICSQLGTEIHLCFFFNGYILPLAVFIFVVVVLWKSVCLYLYLFGKTGKLFKSYYEYLLATDKIIQEETLYSDWPGFIYYSQGIDQR